MTLVLTRCILLLLCGLAGVALRPVPVGSLGDPAGLLVNLLAGLSVGGLGLLAEWRLSRLPLRVLVGGLVGLLVGAAGAYATLAVVRAGGGAGWQAIAKPSGPVVLLAAVIGMLVGARKGSDVKPLDLSRGTRPEAREGACKILDTSVIIDGRIADICETHFIDGTLVVPQFVLRELQFVADSSDALRRNRGRKGLDVLERIKKNSHPSVIFTDLDFPEIRDVDEKLIELARHMKAKIITNDFNLNKVARLRSVNVLNINELANALKPVVLPGETMNVFILKEGREPNQGVAYLDDGTMVVIDNANHRVGQTVQITVTSVLQTTAGKMFFGRVRGSTEKQAPRRAGRGRAIDESDA
ncbi:MAG: PIN/TRAM domain-containing protein [Acidobacteriota bacterium]